MNEAQLETRLRDLIHEAQEEGMHPADVETVLTKMRKDLSAERWDNDGAENELLLD